MHTETVTVPDTNIAITAPYISVRFPVEGRRLPADHGYALTCFVRTLQTVAGHKIELNALRQSQSPMVFSNTPATSKSIVINALRQLTQSRVKLKICQEVFMYGLECRNRVILRPVSSRWEVFQSVAQDSEGSNPEVISNLLSFSSKSGENNEHCF